MGRLDRLSMGRLKALLSSSEALRGVDLVFVDLAMALGREGGFAHRPLIFFCSSLLKALNLVRHIDCYHYITAYI